MSDRVPTPAPADRPSFTILSDGEEISATYQVQAVVITRAVGRVASAELRILDGDPASETFAASSGEDFAPGREIEIKAGYHGEEDRIFKGLLVRHGLRIRQGQGTVLRLECRDAAVRLTVGRKSAYFYDQSDADIIEQIAADAGLDTDVEATEPVHGQMVQHRASDWDFILTRAEANGLLVHTVDGELVAKRPDTSAEPVLQLAFGRSLLEFEATADARDQVRALSSHGWNPADQEALELESDDPDAVTPGNLEAPQLAAVAGPETFELAQGGGRSDAELQAWADARRTRSALAKVRGRARIQGFAGALPGDVVELEGLGDRMNGRALLTGVRHEIDSRNWHSDVAFGLDPRTYAETRPDLVEPAAAGLLPASPGLQVGLVSALEGDPAGEQRIQLRLPLIDAEEEGAWARLASVDAGEERGAVFRPEIGDEVVVGFLGQDPRDPVVLGMLHSSAKPAPIDAADDNHEKGLVTRAGLKLLFDDEKAIVRLETPNGNTFQLSDEDGGLSLVDENDNKLTFAADGVTLESAGDLTLSASGDVTIEGANVTSQASAQLKVEGSAGAEISSGANTVVKGAMVQIN